MRLGAALALVAAITACERYSKEPHPEDVERPAPLSCADAELITLDDLADGGSITPGRAVAIEGQPTASVSCNQIGCESECCENRCGGSYGLSVDRSPNAVPLVTLTSSELRCGGTDCSYYCTPFSSSPKGRYRFIGRINAAATTPRTWSLAVSSYCSIL